MGKNQEQAAQAAKEQNYGVRRNNLIFGLLTILFQVAAGLLYGFLIRPNSPTKDIGKTVLPWFLTFCYAMLVIPGFGLLLSYLKNMLWSGIGFTFFITAFSLQLYFLANALWGWAAIQQGSYQLGKPTFNSNISQYFFSLATISGGSFGNTFTFAFKAALANVVGFSAIIGRAGPLQAWVLTFFGTIGFELQRVILTNYGYDGSGTFTIFIYGGFLGLFASLLLRIRQNRVGDSSESLHHTIKNPNYTANSFSASFALIGTLITWVFFPVLTLDPTLGQAGIHTSYTAPLSVVFALSGSTFASLLTSTLINGKLSIRDVVYGSISGGISSATASTFVTNPVYAILIGLTSGFVQVVGQNLIQRKWAKQNSIVHSTSFILFGVQGIIGAAYAAAWNAIIWTNSNGFTYLANNTPTATSITIDDSFWQILMGFMCIGFGIGFGLVVGIFIICCASHTSKNHFHDFTYWADDDGISFDYAQPQPLNEPIKVVDEVAEVQVVEGNHDIKNQHAYL